MVRPTGSDDELADAAGVSRADGVLLREALVDIVSHKDDLFNLIRWKEIYEMLEETTDRIEDVADVLQRVIIKNG